MNSTAREPREATSGHPSGPASSSDSCVRFLPCRRSADLRPTDLPGLGAGTALSVSALDVRPGLDPLRVVHALVAAAVAARRDRRGPEGDVVEVRLGALVEDLAVVLGAGVLACQLFRGRLAEPLRHLR